MGRVNGAGKEAVNSKANESIRESMDEDKFDTRPIYPDELKAKPGVFRAAINFFRSACNSMLDGVRNAFSAILRAFDSSDAASSALRHIKDGAILPTTKEEDKTGIAKLANTVADAVDDAAEIAVDSAPTVDTGAVDFSHYLRVYKADQAKGVGTVCPQNFEKGATQFAQKIFDAEVKRCAEFVDRPKEYSLSADDQLNIKAAAALLHKQVPHPVPLKFAEKKEVATYSVDEFGSFLAWREWRDSGKLPEAASINLEAAINYAHAYIGKHVKPEYLQNKQVQSELRSAYDLIANQSSYADRLVNINIRDILNDIEELKNDKQAQKLKTPDILPPPPPPPPRVRTNSPPAPPPPRIRQNGPPAPPPARTGAANSSLGTVSAVEAAKAMGLQQTDIEQIASLVIPHIKSPQREQIVFNAMPFVERLHDGRFNPVMAEAALTLAQYWNSAKSSAVTLEQLQALPSFTVLDKLLDIQTIMAQMPPEH